MVRKFLIFVSLFVASVCCAQSSRHDAFRAVISHEDKTFSGVVTNEPFGGLARLGINSLANPQAVSDGFYTMPRQQAISYAYRVFVNKYWNPIKGDSIVNPRASSKFADLAFNIGTKRAIKLVQNTLNQMGAALVVDGIVGPATLASLNFVSMILETEFFMQLQDSAVNYYTRLCIKKHMLHSKWKDNWIARAREM